MLLQVCVLRVLTTCNCCESNQNAELLWFKDHCCLERKGNSSVSEAKAAALMPVPTGSADGGSRIH